MVLLPKNVELSSVQKLPHLPETIEAPVEKGQQIGTMDLKLNDEVIATVPLWRLKQSSAAVFCMRCIRLRAFLALCGLKLRWQ